ncbi:CPBP family intramembrane glutamic endopeptidase [Litorihabitans aurantiacus]|uniref:CAAX prenyl protease 2/Lysostaphin resistance protein A-like domain-containing protein n=1 Tax=Litorihabitans aurantiacus TaxID=1930061 RepID=A0AA37UUK2_9MICO|nr:CPBP family intramembrane glutamic endopeptidase [Litorihabitans aurantiacus]GMA30561.1 hypothetical protein GCM10025875_05530 [Litorihabitans aurantiacus]
MTTPASGTTVTDDGARPGRHLRVWQFLVLVVAYVVVIQVSTRLITGGAETSDSPSSVPVLLREYLVPIGLAAVLVAGVTTALRAWPDVMVESRRLARWTLVIPVVLVLVALGITNYPALAAEGVAFVLVLLVVVLLIGFGEELLFRGLGVRTLRASGRGEVAVGLWVSVTFGAVHLTNALSTGQVGDAVVQSVLATATGFLLYLTLRATGTLVVPMLVHAVFDLGAMSTTVDPDNPSGVTTIAAGVVLVLVLVVLLLRRRLTARA